MVALVGSAAGVEKGELPGYQEGGLVVCYGVRSGEYGAGLAVESAAVSPKARQAMLTLVPLRLATAARDRREVAGL